jgi:hypothetical protein
MPWATGFRENPLTGCKACSPYEMPHRWHQRIEV